MYSVEMMRTCSHAPISNVATCRNVRVVIVYLTGGHTDRPTAARPMRTAGVEKGATVIGTMENLSNQSVGIKREHFRKQQGRI